MLTPGDHRRLKLFRLYAANFSVHVPAVTNVFVCPICTRGFSREAVLHGPGLQVDLGHVYPQEAGGKLVTLECRDCNGRLNRAADRELVRLHQMWEAMKPDGSAGSICGSFEMPSGRVDVEVNSFGISGHERRSNPKAFRELIDAMCAGLPVQFTMPTVDQGKINLAILHSAHLLLFRAFGYEYLACEAGRFCRRILQQADPLDECPFMSVEVLHGELEPRFLYRCGVSISARGTKCLFTVLPTESPDSMGRLILLPGPSERDLAAYQEMYRLGERWLRARLRIFPAIQRHLLAPEYSNSLQMLWRGITDDDLHRSKIMLAIYRTLNGSTARKLDAGMLSQRLGLTRAELARCLAGLANDGFLERAPKKHRPHLVRLTARAVARFRQQTT